MTRENKLALIIGFGLVLVVGILVSDHFSPAERDENADLAEIDVERGGRFAEADTLAPVNVDPASAERPRIRLRPTYPAVNGTHIGNEPGRRDVEPIDESTQTGPRPEDEEEPILREIRNVDLQALQRAESDPPDNISPTSFQWYTIKSGESLSKICQTFYGDVKLWPKLAEFNRDRIPDPDRVPAGVTIRIPSREHLGGGPADADAAPPVPEQEEEEPASGSSSDDQERSILYTIRKGDTLGEIAARFLGTSRRYMEIYELNRDVIPSPDNVIVGRQIRIPQD